MGDRRLASAVYIDGKPYAANTTEADLPADVRDHLADNTAVWTDADTDPDAVVAAGQGITALGSVGEPVTAGADGRFPTFGGSGHPVTDGSAAAANLTSAADEPPAPPAGAVDQLDDLGLGADAGDGGSPDAPPPAGAGQGVEPPPMHGAGSSAAEWREYAGQVGVDVPADAKRDDVVAALQGAGKPTTRE